MADELSLSFNVDTGSLFAYLRKFRLAVDPMHLAHVAREEGQIFVTKARYNLLAHQSKFPQFVYGELYDAIKFDVLPITSKGHLKARFWVDCPYAKAIEFVTPRRTTPPTLREIIAWKTAKVGTEGVVGGIKAYKHMLRHGVKNHPFFRPAYKSEKAKFKANLRLRILVLVKQGHVNAIAAVRTRKYRRMAVITSLRAQLYRWAKYLGWLHAAGLDVSAIRAFMYTMARFMGDATSVTGGSMAQRMMRRGAGGMTTGGISAGMPNVDPLVARALRVSEGRLAGARLRGLSR